MAFGKAGFDGNSKPSHNGIDHQPPNAAAFYIDNFQRYPTRCFLGVYVDCVKCQWQDKWALKYGFATNRSHFRFRQVAQSQPQMNAKHWHASDAWNNMAQANY